MKRNYFEGILPPENPENLSDGKPRNYLVQAVDEVYDAFERWERYRDLGKIIVTANSLEEAMGEGQKTFQENLNSRKEPSKHFAHVYKVFNQKKQVLYHHPLPSREKELSTSTATALGLSLMQESQGKDITLHFLTFNYLFDDDEGRASSQLEPHEVITKLKGCLIHEAENKQYPVFVLGEAEREKGVFSYGTRREGPFLTDVNYSIELLQKITRGKDAVGEGEVIWDGGFPLLSGEEGLRLYTDYLLGLGRSIRSQVRDKELGEKIFAADYHKHFLVPRINVKDYEQLSPYLKKLF